MLLLNEGGINQKTRHAPSSQSSEGNDLLFKHDMYIIINYLGTLHLASCYVEAFYYVTKDEQ
jgi:hypothetical protein